MIVDELVRTSFLCGCFCRDGVPFDGEWSSWKSSFFYYILAWLLLTGTRGKDGVTFVGEYIVKERGCYLAVRKNLVKEAVVYCKQHGRSAISHIDGSTLALTE